MTENKEIIHIIATGGTIDGVYDPASERKVTKSKSNIIGYFKDTIAPHFDLHFKELMMIDSLDMTDDHRHKIADELNNTDADKILITHGTSTMIETAQVIQERLIDKNKTIILVGAMVPLEGFYPTDAPFNLGYAIAQLQTQPGGVYMCMNAHCFSPDEAVKNVDLSRFEFIEKT